MKIMRGRPSTEHKERVVRKIEEALKEGTRLQDVCSAYRIKRSTFHYWRKTLQNRVSTALNTVPLNANQKLIAGERVVG